MFISVYNLKFEVRLTFLQIYLIYLIFMGRIMIGHMYFFTYYIYSLLLTHGILH